MQRCEPIASKQIRRQTNIEQGSDSLRFAARNCDM
jgi:hypothetical protein